MNQKYCFVLKDYQTRSAIRDVDGLNPILELLKSEYAVVQKLALLALDRASQDGNFMISEILYTAFSQT